MQCGPTEYRPCFVLIFEPLKKRGLHNLSNSYIFENCFWPDFAPWKRVLLSRGRSRTIGHRQSWQEACVLMDPLVLRVVALTGSDWRRQFSSSQSESRCNAELLYWHCPECPFSLSVHSSLCSSSSLFTLSVLPTVPKGVIRRHARNNIQTLRKRLRSQNMNENFRLSCSKLGVSSSLNDIWISKYFVLQVWMT